MAPPTFIAIVLRLVPCALSLSLSLSLSPNFVNGYAMYIQICTNVIERAYAQINI